MGVVVVALGLLAWACNGRVVFDAEGCDEDQECPLPTLHCDREARTCVGCTTDAHCTATGQALPRCDTARHRCVECGLDADCGQGRACRQQHCVTLCEEEGDSPSCPTATPHCERSLGFCILCEKFRDACASATAAGPLCDPDIGICVSCLADSDCGGTSPHCDTVKGRCVECLGSAQCRPAAPVCDPVALRCVTHTAAAP